MTDTGHPFAPGTRVRHAGRQWTTAAFATVLEAVPQHDRTFEYRVAVDADSDWPTAGTETWWASYHTRIGTAATPPSAPLPAPPSNPR